MKYLSAICLVFLTACAPKVAVKPAFPDIPPSLKTGCNETLTEVPVGTDKPSEVLTTVKNNYAEYFVCKAKVDSWMEWYAEQKRIYNSK